MRNVNLTFCFDLWGNQDWTTAEDGEMALTDYRHGMFSQGTISIELQDQTDAFCLSHWDLTIEPVNTEKSWCKSATRKQGNSYVDPQKGMDLNI